MRAHPRHRRALRRQLLLALVGVLSFGTAACSGATPTPPTGGAPGPTGGSTASTSSIGTSSVVAGGTGSTTPSGSTTSLAPSTSAPSATPTGSASCSALIAGRLSPAEAAGQLLMVGLDVNAGRTSLDALVRQRHVGGVILLGGWYDGAAAVRATTSHLAGLASADATGGLGLFLAADQEGGNVQQLRGSGFTRIGTARTQSQLSPSALATASATWAGQLKAAGVNVNLAPVADTVPTSIGRANQPIGRYDRQFSSDPDRNADLVSGFIQGMHRGGVAATVKHFPGIGRITGNTDVTATGITDSTTTVTDAYLRPFAAGIKEGADFVMVGSAIYSKIDPGTNAVFSKAVITDLLRGRMGYGGVVITDDVGAAKAVAAVPVAQRATRFIAAGGDIVLTARPATIATMHDALTERMATDPAFAAQVGAAAARVIDLKVRLGLAHCS